MLLGLAGCTAPADAPVGAWVMLLCVINCPLSVSVADEGRVTDAQPQEYIHLDPDAVRAAR